MQRLADSALPNPASKYNFALRSHGTRNQSPTAAYQPQQRRMTRRGRNIFEDRAMQRTALLILLSFSLAGCISSSNPSPPADRTVVVPVR